MLKWTNRLIFTIISNVYIVQLPKIVGAIYI